MAIKMLGILSTALQAVGAFQAAKARKQQAEYQAQVARNNAVIAEQNVRDAEIRGREREYEQRRRVSRALSSQRAATAGAGLMVDEVGTTPQDLVVSMVEAGELDVLKIRDNTLREQRGHQIQADSHTAQAGQYQLQADSESPFLAALSAGVGAAGRNADILFPNAGVA